MKTILQALFVLTFSALVGGYSAWRALQSEYFFNSIVAGQWKANQVAQNDRTQPYERARLALHSQAQLGSGEGLRFVAIKDNNGDDLMRNCSYQIAGPAPKAQIFTLFATDLDGQWLSSGIGLNDFHHAQSLGYSLENHLNIRVSAKISIGDWLNVPLGENGAKPYQLVMKLYDTSIGALSDYTNVEMPEILLVNCA